MRIISGCRRGHRLFEFKGRDIRPTTDRVKESVFNLIQGHIEGAAVLDMFAGTGALSLEALSRGAANAVMVDKDRRSAEIIRKNIAALGFGDRCRIIEGSCFDYARRAKESFDLIFLDPPYNKGLIEQALGAICENGLLSADGIIVLESDNTDFKSEYGALNVIKQKRYGRTYITVYTSRSEEL